MKPTVFVVFAIGLSFLIGKTDAQAACVANDPNNGNAEPNDPADTTSVTYTCDSGYTISNAATVLCSNGVLGAAEPTCAGDACSATLTDGTATPSAPAHQATVAYTCNSGFTLDGTTPLTCTAGSLGTEPTCKAGCTATAPTNGLVDGAGTSSVTNTNTVTYSCNGGYTLSSAATLTCTSGSLVGTVPTCDGDPCTASNPANGAASGTSITHGSTVTYTCNSGFSVVGSASATCTASVLSPATAPTCETAPAFDANAPTTESVDENTAVGTTVTSAIIATGDVVLSYALTSQTPDSTPKVFAVDATSGLLTIAESPDYEVATTYTLVITSTSSKGTANDATDDTSSEHTITVTIVDVAEGSSTMLKASILTTTLLVFAKYL